MSAKCTAAELHPHLPAALLLRMNVKYFVMWNYCHHCINNGHFIFYIDLSARVDAVKEENLKLKSENQVLGQYIENLMSASSVFQTTDTKSKRK